VGTIFANLTCSARFKAFTIRVVSNWTFFTSTLALASLKFAGWAHEAMATVEEMVVLSGDAVRTDLTIASVLNKLAVWALDPRRHHGQQHQAGTRAHNHSEQERPWKCSEYSFEPTYCCNSSNTELHEERGGKEGVTWPVFRYGGMNRFDLPPWVPLELGWSEVYGDRYRVGKYVVYLVSAAGQMKM
jgi:hypothetical protein